MKLFKVIFKLFVVLIVIFSLSYLGLYIYVKNNPIDIKINNSYYIYDNDSKLVNSMSDEWIKLDSISNNLINATLSIEDKNFYKHNGFD